MPNWLRRFGLAVLAVVLAAVAVPVVSSVADAAAVCLTDSDPDGDGWGWENGQSCEMPEPISVSSCDYSEARMNGGWGWDPVAGQSCPPHENDLGSSITASVEVSATTAVTGCDYSDAAANGGWGWNPVTGQSCRPDERQDSGSDGGPTPPRLVAAKRADGATILLWLDDPGNADAYRVERDGRELATVENLVFIDHTADDDQFHVYSVAAMVNGRVGRQIRVPLPPRTEVQVVSDSRSTAEEVVAAQEIIRNARVGDLGQFIDNKPPNPWHFIGWLFQRVLNGSDPASAQITDYTTMVNDFLQDQDSEMRLPNPRIYPGDSVAGSRQAELADQARAEISDRIKAFHDTYGEYPNDAELADLIERVITKYEARGLTPERGPGRCEGGLSEAESCSGNPANLPGPCEGGLAEAESCSGNPSNLPGPCEGGLTEAESCGGRLPGPCEGDHDAASSCGGGGSPEPDQDNDGIPDSEDLDIDGDGVDNYEDLYPTDPERHKDEREEDEPEPDNPCVGSHDAASSC